MRRAGRQGIPASAAARSCAITLAGLLLTACASGPMRDGPPRDRRDVASIPDAVPRIEPRSRYGNPSSYVVDGRRYYVMDSARGYAERGIASWYGRKFHGRRTSSGEIYDMYGMSAAHRRLPLPTYVRVSNLRNGRQVVVRVNDRGPFKDNRLIDLSYAAAAKLAITEAGTGLVEVQALDAAAPRMRTAARTQPVNLDSREPRLYLQVGAFVSEHNARQLLGRLQDADLGQVRIEQTHRHQRAVYRVRVGPLASVEAADDLADRLAVLGIEQMHVVVD
ncbi:MAG: septal ring lytic transglycosylase RlpA family protein [Gammaproteobacteria bacterium]|nr:septal ring lytic transglycosylase RlpA family protein [Gammaproteobacteria bacterium]